MMITLSDLQLIEVMFLGFGLGLILWFIVDEIINRLFKTKEE